MRQYQRYSRRLLATFLILLFIPALPGISYADDGKVLTLPENLTVIAKEAFCGDTSIQKVVLQEGVTSIQSRAFADCSLLEIQLPASLTYIAEDAFEDTDLQTFTAPKGSYAYTWGREHKYITEYRALLIGEKTFLGDGETIEVLRNSNDVAKMAGMLGKVYGPEGTKYKTTRKINAGYYAIQSAIRTTFVDTMEQDISIFFIASHGNNNGDGELMMPFTGDPNNNADRNAYEANKYLSFETLASWLSVINGKVIVILESCGAGSAIYVESNGLQKRGEKTEDEKSEDFVQAAVKAFAKVDPGITTVQEVESNRKSTGNLIQPKFYVLAAAAHHEESYGYSNTSSDPVNLFTKWLIQGVGEKGNAPADADSDSVLVLDELHTYIKNIGDGYKIPVYVNGKLDHYTYQHVQVYPENCEQAIFLLK